MTQLEMQQENNFKKTLLAGAITGLGLIAISDNNFVEGIGYGILVLDGVYAASYELYNSAKKSIPKFSEKENITFF